MSRSDEIRAAAVKLFYERGYKATSLKDIADVLQMRAPSLYNHIESKQKLLQDIMFDGIDSLIEDFDQAVAGSDDVIEQIQLAAEALCRHNIRRRTQAYVNTYEIPSLEEPARSHLVKRRQAYVKRWATLVEKAVGEGRSVADEPMLVTFNIIDMGSGISRWYRPGGRWSEVTLVPHFGQLVLRMLDATTVRKTAPRKAATHAY